MDAESLSRLSAWPALICYGVTLGLWMRPSSNRREQAIRVIWTAGWLALVCHVAIAFSMFHGGSWAAAYEHTAQRTQAAVGWNWGGGVWFNLVTAIVWGIDVVGRWIRPISAPPESPRPRILPREWAVQIYLAFMMFNATVVFGSFPAQIAGGLICVGVAAMAATAAKRCPRGRPPASPK